MAVEKDRGYVLEHVRLSDHRFIVNLYCEGGGRRKGVFRMSKQQPSALLTPLSLWSFQIGGREHQELKSISRVNLESHHFDLGSSYLGLTLLQHLAKLVFWSQPEAHADERIFRLLGHVLAALEASPEPRRMLTVNLYFEIWLLHFAGLLPRTGKIRENGSATESGISGEARLWQQLSPQLTRAAFERTVEDFTPHALQLGSLSQAQDTLGKFWEHFLSRELKTRALLTRQFQERRPW